MSAHDHQSYVDGCFRCDLSRVVTDDLAVEVERLRAQLDGEKELHTKCDVAGARERDVLRERVATLEGGIRKHRDTALGVELFWSHDEHLWSLLDPEDTP